MHAPVMTMRGSDTMAVIIPTARMVCRVQLCAAQHNSTVTGIFPGAHTSVNVAAGQFKRTFITFLTVHIQAAGTQAIADDASARVSVLSTWLRSILDPYARTESALLTVLLSELPAFAGVAPARQAAARLDAVTHGAIKASLWQHEAALHVCDDPTNSLRSVCAWHSWS